MKRTLERELKVLEIAEREANVTSTLGKTAALQCEQTPSFSASVVGRLEILVCSVAC